LYNLAADRWQDIDAIVIVDGLDEIAQRSRYEEIQRKLANMILTDLDARTRPFIAMFFHVESMKISNCFQTRNHLL